ncbi:MAG: AMP-binding protein [Planctomyces sp.]|nr:AMP-binding protein [Planctomyces sp.]
MHVFTLDSLLRIAAERWPDNVAISDGNRTVTYAELNDLVSRVTGWLVRSGLRRGDRVVVHLRKSIEEVAAMFAVARAGGVFVNIHPQWTVSQLQHVLSDSGAQILIAESRRGEELFKSGGFSGSLVVTGPQNVKGGILWSDVIQSEPNSGVRLIDADLAALLYTSGSTGMPKGVMLTHSNLIAGARSVATYLQNSEADLLLSVLPFCFDYGLSQLTTMCLVGGGVFLLPVAMPAEIVRSLVSHPITGFAAVPPIWVQLVHYLKENPTEFGCLRYITNSGGHIPEVIMDEFERVLPGVSVFLMYGLTEAFRSTYLSPEKFSLKKGSIGQAIPNAETFIISEGKGVCGPGEVGELVHRGSLVSQGYWNQPELTAAKIRECPELAQVIGREKVLYSGDLIRVDEDGDYWFVGRRDDMIKCSGFRISPTEVESVVSEGPEVEHVVAFGVYHEQFGQAVEIAVSARTSGSIDSSQLMQFCRSRLANYMVPQRIHVWEGAMPRTASGKIDRPAVVKFCKSSG